jgi:hypothetical protein
MKQMKRRVAWRRARPALMFVLLALFIVLIWLGSISYIRHGLPGSHPRPDRLETLAKIGEAMTITNVLFAGLAFLGLIVTVWFQRKQVESAIEGMQEQSSHLMEPAVNAEKTLEALRAQSDAMLMAARISALAIIVPAKEHEIERGKADRAIGRNTEENRNLETSIVQHKERLALIERYLKELSEEKTS